MSRAENDNELGDFLKDRRGKLDAAALGYPMARRRTPGLRREEVAQRANVSTTWYTWLEQGRGGAPSADVLDRLARGLELTDAEREHLFFLAQNRPPEVQYQEVQEVAPRLQRVLDALETSPAYVRTSEWDILAWNRAAVAVLGDYGALPVGERNILFRFFSGSGDSAHPPHREELARAMVASFRAETARSGASGHAKALIERLSRISPEFRNLWLDRDVIASGEGVKSIRKPTVGSITLEYSTFAVEGKPDLSLVVFNPATPGDKAVIRSLIAVYGYDEARLDSGGKSSSSAETD